MTTEVCKHCNKGANHWTEWDFASGDKNGNGQCKNPSIEGGCVGDWGCHYVEPTEKSLVTKVQRIQRQLDEAKKELKDFLNGGK